MRGQPEQRQATAHGHRADRQIEGIGDGFFHSPQKQPVNATYAKELQKLLESLTRAAKLEEAAVVKKEFEKMSAGTVARRPDPFVGIKWVTQSGTQFTFEADGTGLQSYENRKTPLKWTKGPNDVLTVEGEAQFRTATWYFKFTDEKTGVFGESPDKLDKALTAK